MGELLALIGVAAAGVVFVLPIVAYWRSRRIAGIEQRLGAAEAQIFELALENKRLREQQAIAPRALPEPSFVAPIAPRTIEPEPKPESEPETKAPTPALEPPQTVAVSPTPPSDAAPSVIEAPSEAPSKDAPPDDAAPPQAPPTQASPPPTESAPPPAPPPSFNWEQWLGVRGAAALAGIVLALAGILFFNYSIQHGLISPAMRVVIGCVVGLGCYIACIRMRKYEVLGNGLGGAGAVILYACFWAARALYGLIPMPVAFVLMALVTTTSALFAVRFSSLLIASLGLAGGFLTPLLLSTGQNKPVGLFGYLLVLDTGFLIVALRRRWGGLALAALVGTLGLEALWVGGRMEPGQLAIGLCATGLFAVLFVVAGARAPKGETTLTFVVTRAAAILLPHAFALYFAVDAQLGEHLYPIALLLLLLECAALYVAARLPEGDKSLAFLPTATAAGTLTVVTAWCVRAELTASLAWEAALVCAVLAIPAVFVALRRKSLDVPSLLYPAGLFAILAILSLSESRIPPWSFVVGLTLLAAQVVTLAYQPKHAHLARFALPTLALVLVGETIARNHVGPTHYLLVELGLFVVAYTLALARFRRGDEVARALAEGALGFGALVLLGFAAWDRLLLQAAPFPFLMPLVWSTLLVAAVILRGRGRLLPIAALPLFFVHGSATRALWDGDPHAESLALLVCMVTVLFFTQAPFIAWPRMRSRVPFYVAALAGPAWLLPSLALYRDRYGTLGQGMLPLIYAAMTLALLPSIRRKFLRADPMRKSALVWVAASALGLLSAAIPLELDQQWITIGYALEAGAVLFLWRRLDHPGLKYFALALTVCVAVRLCLNPSVLVYEQRGHLRILNWVLYTYWVPALALVAGIYALAPLEAERKRAWEAHLPNGLVSRTLGGATIAIVFVWINLAISDWFDHGERLALDFSHLPARDLATSISWAIYAIVLLALGVWRKQGGLRWVSLGMLLLTIGKVFLYDLAELHDLYRVLSLVGLAFSLILVSLAYQRFVFRRPEKS